MRYIQYMFVELNSFSLDNRSSKSVFAWCTLCAVPGWGVCGRMCENYASLSENSTTTPLIIDLDPASAD